MSRTLIWRELRRQAPGALVFVVGVVGLWAWALGQPTHNRTLQQLASGGAMDRTIFEFTAWSLVLGGLAFSALAGVVTVAPDTAQGGTAFLFRMPASPAQLAASKLAGVATYLPGWVLLGLAARALDPAPGVVLLQTGVPLDMAGPSLSASVAVACPLGFAFGLVATVLVGRALPALLLAPILALGVGLGLCVAPLLAWEVQPQGFYFVVLPVVSAAAVAAAWLGFSRGDPHRPSPKPALYALGIVAPATLILAGGTGVAQAWTLSGIHDALRVSVRPAQASRDGAHLAVELYATPWSGVENRVAVIDRERDEQWVLPCRNVWEPEFSPDGKQLLVRNYMAPGGYLADLEHRTVVALPGRSREGFGYRFTCWTAEGPLMVEQAGGALRSWQPVVGDPDDPLRDEPQARSREAFCALPPGVTLLGVRGSEALLADAGGLWACPVPRRVELPAGAADAALELPQPELTLLVGGDLGETHDALLSASGDLLLTLDGNLVRVFDLQRGTQFSCSGVGLAPLGTRRGELSFDPCETRLAVVDQENVTVLDLKTGDLLVHVSLPAGQGMRRARNEPWTQKILSWSPSGDLLGVSVLHPEGDSGGTQIFRLERPDAVIPLGSEPLTGFVSDQRMLVAEQPLGVLELVPSRPGKVGK